MARTRALRDVCRRAMCVPSASIRSEDEDVIDVEELPGAVEGSVQGADGTNGDPARVKDGAEPAPDDAPSSPVDDDVPPDGSEPPDPHGDPNSEPPADEEGLYVGLLFVTPAKGGPYKPATERKELRTAEQVEELKALLNELSLAEGALGPVCKARYKDANGNGISDGQITRIQAAELKAWLETRIALAKKATT
jgi:hypothetical protein